MPDVDNVAPLRLTQREHTPGFPRNSWCEHRYIDLYVAATRWIGNNSRSNLSWQSPESAHGGGDGELATHLLEMGTDDLCEEPSRGVAPDGRRAATLEQAPLRTHDHLVERYQRLRDPVDGTARAKHVRFSTKQPAVFQYVDVVTNVGGLAADVAGDSTAGIVATRYGREDRMVQRRFSDVGLLL